MPFFVLKHISKVFRIDKKRDFPVLNDVSLSFESKGLVSIIGKSGSGKSTLLNIMMGLEKPTKGNVIYKDKDITKLSKKDFSTFHLLEVGMVYQHYNLFEDLSPLENVMLPLLLRGENKQKARESALRLFQKFQLGYLNNQKTKTLSGGEKQRVAILRAMIISPKVLLCDEPTGALDSKNAIFVMDMFKEISKSILVVMVSHQQNLVDTYSDRIIQIKDGNIVGDKVINQYKSDNAKASPRITYSGLWKNLFLRNNLKANLKKNIFSLLVNVFGFLTIMVSFGFSNGSKASERSALKNNLSSEVASICEKSVYKVDNSPLSYIKQVRPDVNVVDTLIEENFKASIGYNFDYCFPSYQETTFEGNKITGGELVPIYSLKDSLTLKNIIKYGEIPYCDSLEEVIINTEFAKTFNISYEELLGRSFNISSSTTFSYLTGDTSNPIIKDTYVSSYNVKILGIVEEFNFLNTPKIYYSYLALEEELKNVVLENESNYSNKIVSVYDKVAEADNGEAVSSYSYRLFFDNDEEINKMYEYIATNKDNENSLEITSVTFEIYQTYSSLMDTFSLALFVFMFIAFIGVNFIIAMLSLSSFIERKKESAILTCLGARDRTIINIFLYENYLTIFASLILAFSLIFPLQLGLNYFFEASFMLKNLISVPFKSFLGIPYAFPPLIILTAVIVSTLFIVIPVLIYKNRSVVEELRDE